MTGATTSGRKRFYKEVSITEVEGDKPGFRVLLDGRPIRTPAKRELMLPRRELAEAAAEEWRRQGAIIEPLTMPLTRLVNSALDGVEERAVEVRAALLAYGDSDLICYLAEGPRELIERQARSWGEIHAWIKQDYGVELELSAGIMPVRQSETMLARLDKAIGDPRPLELAALHVITTLTGSLLLALAVHHARLTPEQAWSLAHLDEDYQAEQWGHDAEAEARRAHRWQEMQAAAVVLAKCRCPG
jgi:chaperone required for assembly of F1-ATPase